ncbi:FecR family protein [Nostoc sp. FACHB-110]|uniref:FecR family protein n=1 Tax=Nostoc sp. FACHB-110 TaxID=2692834 RepID=UPI0016880CD1|nr:FecR family protein [Nostoc sp. FACHB-110]MBD2437646.1 FecR domain-containing protein [Nostoc sp. FACHB-110]
MYLKHLSCVFVSLWGVIAISSNQVSAATPLTRAEIQNLQNLVQLLPKNNKKRPARKLDPMIPGDGLATGRLSLADLRFNDGSLARVGERALFKFLPKTRNFMLSNGTLLLLIPPGKGQTRIQTPSAAAAIRGSALFVRYDQQTDTTVVGALTNSGIEVFNQEASQNQVLAAGQLIVIVKGKFQGLYDFDLRSFYETSELVKGLNLTKKNITPNPDPAIASVQAEIDAALAFQLPIVGQGVIKNPSFLELSASSPSSSQQSIASDNPPVESLVETGQFLLNNVQQSTPTNSGSSSNIPSQPSTPISPVIKPPDNTPKPPDNTPKPPDNTPKPPDDTPKPPDNTPKPPDNTPKPPDNTPKPPDDTPKLPDDTPKPPDDTPKPPDDTPKPPPEYPAP